jgi:3-hydroxyisobutyrate dehydrogenase
MTQAMATDTVAVLGAGSPMGFPVARSVVLAGIPLRAWDSTSGAAQGLADYGAYVAATSAKAADGAGIVLTMIDDIGELTRVMRDEVIPVMRRADPDPHAIWLQMSAIGEEATRECIRLANSNGVGFVDAPLNGSTRDAGEGNLVVLESGPEEARPRIQPVFDAIGYRTIRAGQAGAASRAREERSTDG